MRLIRIFLIVVALVIGIAHVQAQEISMSDLVDKTWKAVSGYDGSEFLMTIYTIFYRQNDACEFL